MHLYLKKKQVEDGFQNTNKRSKKGRGQKVKQKKVSRLTLYSLDNDIQL